MVFPIDINLSQAKRHRNNMVWKLILFDLFISILHLSLFNYLFPGGSKISVLNRYHHIFMKEVIK